MRAVRLMLAALKGFALGVLVAPLVVVVVPVFLAVEGFNDALGEMS